MLLSCPIVHGRVEVGSRSRKGPAGRVDREDIGKESGCVSARGLEVVWKGLELI